MIADLGHIALRVPDVDASVDHAEEVLGLREVERIDGVSYLTCDGVHDRVRYIPADEPGLDSVGFIARDREALGQVTERLEAAGVDVSTQASGPAIPEAIRFQGPDGHWFEVYESPRRSEPVPYPTHGLGPTRFGHVTLTAPDIFVTEKFFIDVLGFRLSDRIAPGMGTWLRCSSEHHIFAILKGDVTGMHHYAFDVPDLQSLGRLGDILSANGKLLIFGPGRHGPGNNLYTYHLDPAGACVEVCAEMIKILDEDGWVPGEWPLEPETEDIWGPQPPEWFDGLCTPNVTTAGSES